MLKSPYKTIVQDNGTIKIYGNCHKIPVIFGNELTDKQKKHFDYYDKEDKIYDHAFFSYRGNVYDLAEFMRVDDGSMFAGFDGYLTDSFFSGILIRWYNDGGYADYDYLQAFLFLS